MYGTRTRVCRRYRRRTSSYDVDRYGSVSQNSEPPFGSDTQMPASQASSATCDASTSQIRSLDVEFFAKLLKNHRLPMSEY